MKFRQQLLRTGILRSVTAVSALGLLMVSTGCDRSKNETSPAPMKMVNGYPAPRFPKYIAEPTDADLLAAARVIVRQPHGLAPLGTAQPGQTVHVILQFQQDMRVWEAIRKAWAERGIKAIGVPIWTVAGMTKPEFQKAVTSTLLRGEEGWKEIGVFDPIYMPYLPAAVQKEIGTPLTIMSRNRLFMGKFLDAHPEIEHLYVDPGGGVFFFSALAGDRHASKFLGNWMYEDKTDLLMKSSAFPSDVWSMIEDKVVRPIDKVSEGSFIDPEGTRLHWAVTRPEAVRWKQFASVANNHMFLYPHPRNATEMSGVICGSANHVGFFPRMCVHLDKHGRVVRVEGGGKNGDLFRHLVTQPLFANAKFPTAKNPGYWYISPDGFATNPKFIRNMETLVNGSTDFTNLSERQRGGVQHFSFSSFAGLFDATPAEINKALQEKRGMGRLFDIDPNDILYAKANRLPISHTAHVHVYFGTVKYRLRDNGEVITISEKGNVSAYSNPEVRALAAKYGDPDTLLSYDWVPGIPGINEPGDYQKEYARDPWSWLAREWKQITEGSYPYLGKE